MSLEDFDRRKQEMLREIAAEPMTVEERDERLQEKYPHEYRTVEEIRAGIFHGARHVKAMEPQERGMSRGVTLT